jgi:phenylacetate-CoA ligase
MDYNVDRVFVDRFYDGPRLLSREDVRQWQLRLVKTLLRRAYNDSPFYRQRFEEADLTPDSIRTLEDFSAMVPTVDKLDFLKDQEASPPFGRRLAIPEEDIRQIHLTSGTSGIGQELYAFSDSDMDLLCRAWTSHLETQGMVPGDITLLTWPIGTSTAGLNVYEACREMGMVCLSMGNYDVETKIKFMQRFSPHHIVASPTYLVRMAMICKQKGVDPQKDFPRLKAISIAAEPYPIEWAIRMQEFWNCPIIDCYGCTQSAGLVGISCPQGLIRDGGRGSIHLTEAYTYVEILNPESNEPVDYGDEGEVTLTLLPREGTPVIRFRMRDKVRIFPASDCNCGSSFDFLEAGVIGRYDDMIKIKVCNIWPQTVDNIVFAYPEIEEYNGIVWIDENGSERVMIKVEYKEEVSDEKIKGGIAKELREKIRRSTQVSMDIEEVPNGTLEKALFKSRRWEDKRVEGLGRLSPKEILHGEKEIGR